MVEHYLDTVGVRGSKPLPRTISVRPFVQGFPLQLLPLVTASLVYAETISPGAAATRTVFSTVSGPVHNALLYAPNVTIRSASLPRNLVAHGVFKMDLDSGTPYDVRVVQSTGYKELDNAAVETLGSWRFVPHRLTWVTIPIEFKATTSGAIANDRPEGAKAIAIYAPKPEYPLEARQHHLTGAGIIMLDVNVLTGEVTKAYMLKSMGHKTLDEAALSAFRKWRFKPGKATPKVKIPIRYSMNGTTY